MKISLNDPSETVDPNVVASAIDQAFQGTRFVLDITIEWRRSKRGRNVVKLSTIRLTEPKPYCGNHPDACEVGLIQGSQRASRCLEGADWVDFNDRLNDVLDGLHVSADVASSVCVIRKGTERRVTYTSEQVGRQRQWVKVGAVWHYADYCGQVAPASEYPEGTPGSYEREVVPA